MVKKRIKLTKPPYPQKFSSFTLKLLVKNSTWYLFRMEDLWFVGSWRRLIVIVFTLFNARRHLRGNVGMLGVWNVSLFPRHFHTIRLFHLHRFFINKVSRDQIIVRCVEGKHNNKISGPFFFIYYYQINI